MVTIYGELYSSKNSKRVFCRAGKTIVLPSKAFNANIKPIEQQLFIFKNSWLSEIRNAQKPLKIVFKIYRKTHRRFDYINIVQGLLDSMTKCGWIQDDNADEVLPIFYEYEVDKYNPRVEISIKGEE